MKLLNILECIDYELIKGNLDIDILDLRYDSREIEDGFGFVAMRGIDVDGHNYIDSAVKNGASCIFIDKDIEVAGDVTVIKLKDTRRDLAIMSSNLFENPSDKLIKIAITGTKGKTTTSWMIKSILEETGSKVGVIGTMGTFINGELYEHKNTTPESYLVQKYLKMMVDNGCKYLVMEVSSQALKVGRVSNIIYDYAIFTNLSLDHVGSREHPDFDDYKNSKAMLFRQSKVGIFNSDDKYFSDMIENATCKVMSYGSNGSDLKILFVDYCNNNDFLGIKFMTEGIISDNFLVSAPGLFSAYNACSAIMLCKLLGIDEKVIHKSLEKFYVDGRCEIINLDNNVKVIIDYAHNKISMESIIKTMREYKSGRIVAVFGCGGGRSSERRYELGEMAGKYADFSIITMDNPRYDDIKDINKDIENGIKDNNGQYIIIEDRDSAIRYAIENAESGDIILLMGKGHEKFQEVNGVIYDFDEREIVSKYIKK